MPAAIPRDRAIRVRLVLATSGLLTLGPSAARAQMVDTAGALAGLRDAAAACQWDAGALWGRSLCGPVALVERETRVVLANDTAAGQPFLPYASGTVVSTLPAGQPLANTSFAWDGRPWSMVLLPLPADRFARAALLLHEAFHREQPTLGLGGTDPLNAHLDERDGRYWLRLELRALAAGLDALARGDTAGLPNARRHAADAALFRARRYARYPNADTLEAALEMHEGLAEYTGERLAMFVTGEGPARVARGVRAFDARPTYVRSFAYATGPALGLLLDRLRPAWRPEVRRTRRPGTLLATAVASTPLGDSARAAVARATAYGGPAIALEEEQRDAARRQRVAYLRARFVDGPTLVLRQRSLDRSFDPNELVPLGAAGTVYPTGTFGGPWGTLEVRAGGALVASDFSAVRVAVTATPPDTAAGVIRGDGWTLTLAPGWTARPSPARRGDLEAVRQTR
jgi:hypothetical protein